MTQTCHLTEMAQSLIQVDIEELPSYLLCFDKITCNWEEKTNPKVPITRVVT